MKSTLDLKLQGHVPANRDAIVKITQEATGVSLQRKPFLDGSLLVRDLDPGFYELEVSHPNLIDVIDRRRIRVFPTPQPTRVFVPVPSDLFRDTPIRDVPDADLGPVQALASSARTAIQPMGAKIAGEAIRAADWNTLVGAVSDLATCVLELTALVAPRGHDHPEIAEKIGEVQENMRRFAESFGKSLLELRREIETENLRTQVTDVLDRGNADAATRTLLFDRLAELETSVQSDTLNFTRKLSTTGSVLLNTVNELAVAQGADADTFLNEPSVQKLTGVARQYADAGTQTKAEGELLTYQKSTSVGGSKLGLIIGR
jgi:predicted lipid carrier protein YhbT